MSGADRLISGLEIYGTAGFIPSAEVRELGERHGRVIHSHGLVHDRLRRPLLTALQPDDYSE